MADTIDPSKLKQVGRCEDCGEPAYSTRHGECLVLDTDESGNIVGSHTEPVEYYMCIIHKAKYMWYMDKKRKALATKRRGHRHVGTSA